MKRHIPGLHSVQPTGESPLMGAFLVRVAKAYYRWHPQKPFLILHFTVLEPKAHEARTFSGRLYCTTKALWKLNWFLRDFGYDPDLLHRDQVDEKALVNLRGIIRTSTISLGGRPYQNLDAFAPAGEWDESFCDPSGEQKRDPNDDLQSHTNQ